MREHAVNIENRCLHPITTTRTVPIERYNRDGTMRRRVPAAQWHTCVGCGASFYQEATLQQEGYAVQPTPPPAQANDVYC